ncbi:DEDD exonuclease domain-containing protein [Jatrophihabitans sp. YIM 134969]
MSAATATAPERIARQLGFDELDEPLRETTFVVVDLETTGGSAASEAITEIGAVKVRGGEVIGEFATLVDPGRAIPPFISVLTGITDVMVAQAPRLDAVLPSFLEWARGSVLVAHNAPFDVGFLKAGAASLALAWPGFAVVDTAVLARRVLTRDEVPNCKLSTLAPFFRAEVQPNHRALTDARATVDVLHGLIARLGSLGVQSLPELRAFTAQVTEAQRRKRHLADGLPRRPGVYVFQDARGIPLYVGTSKDVGARVRQYFVASETRTRMGEMIGLAESVETVVCAHALEAQVREVRLIAAHKPRYNRRSKFPERSVWLKLTREAFPRLSIVRKVADDGAAYLGPLRTKAVAEQVRDAVHDAVPLRQCSDRLSVRRIVRAACALAGIGRCSAPCENPSDPGYAALVEVVARAWSGDARELVAPLERKIAELSSHQRYEQAGVVRDRMTSLVRACARMQRMASLTRISELVAAAPDGAGGWDLAIVRYGRLAGAAHAPVGTPPYPVIDAATAIAEVVAPGTGPAPAALAEETELVLRWLERPGVRLVRSSEGWSSPAFGAGALRNRLGDATVDRTVRDPFADRRRLRPVAQPVRAPRARHAS